MLPPLSVPKPSGDPPKATIAASPPLEPPGVRPRSHGLFVRRNSGLSHSLNHISCGRFVLPSSTAPAARSRATSTASASAGRPLSASTPIVVSTPATSKHSFTVNGMPASGPAADPRGRPSSARAASVAGSSSGTTSALTAGSWRWILAMCSSSSSSAPISRAASFAASARSGVSATVIGSAWLTATISAEKIIYMIFRPVDVLGQPVDPDITLLLHHEHLCCDATCWHQPSDDPETEQPVAEADLEDVRRRPWSYADNLQLVGDDLVADEIGLIPSRRPAIIDVTPVDIGRSPQGLRAIAERTGVQVFMGCGRYVEGARAGETPEDAAFYRDEIIRDLEQGVDGVRAGVIGEIGVSNPITPLEEASLRGAAQAQRQTGAPFLVHIDGWDPNAHEALDIVEEEGADLSQTLVCHLDWSVAMRSIEY